MPPVPIRHSVDPKVKPRRIAPTGSNFFHPAKDAEGLFSAHILRCFRRVDDSAERIITRIGLNRLTLFGMVLAIEPMVNMGAYKTKTLPDGWTVVAADGLPSAHFEHTVLTTERGPEILTVPR